MNLRYCDREMGEQIGWLISPLLEGFDYGFLATDELQWLDHLVDWSDSWIRRGVREPYGCIDGPNSTPQVPTSMDLIVFMPTACSAKRWP